MKKNLTGIVSTGLALTLGILGVSAASGSGQNAAVTERDRDGSGVFGEAPAKTDDGKVKYRDDNGDGICDYKESVSVVCVNDSDGDGVCDYRENAPAACFNDSDGDGACDYKEDNERPLKGSGAHCGWQKNSQPGTDQGNSSLGRSIQHRRGR